MSDYTGSGSPRATFLEKELAEAKSDLKKRIDAGTGSQIIAQYEDIVKASRERLMTQMVQDQTKEGLKKRKITETDGVEDAHVPLASASGMAKCVAHDFIFIALFPLCSLCQSFQQYFVIICSKL
jgi:hypothetical protein